MIELLLPSLLAGLAVALVSGPMGAFVVWRRMAFFGDTLAHGALLGAALALALDVNLYLAVVVACLSIALALTGLQQQRQIAGDTLLGIVAHTTLALGVISLSVQQSVQVDLMAYLFGDLLAVTWNDVLALWAGAALIIALVVWQWRALLSITVNEELAQVEGVPVALTRLLLMLLLALLIAGAIRTVGVLLITSLLVIPAAGARRLSSTPEQMAMRASVLGLLSVTLGMAMSWYADTPVGPSIVVAAATLFVLTLLRRPPS
ncbi:Zinc ABC transporter permease protein [Alloalcanivorax dieselolei B5]|uniref:High-affinity zinc uptake system membrane protein ZnuB n=1 Tax=Alcanivorax dieselolei (strain DSM 16502 / CGMCC 1.3690 / MCCC 1A00001 / B-5) TaxID=930169 RepID=K0CJJ8_ALCDB|nr:zinc ABC transporter permease subunit ZnuB [Alloalcanivorax dieselolei]AFT72595.1 Zinc ABC transporter permease protein [Alloalcanivorax dieselolei B5]GGJ79025.1 zinc ABC transporter permease [Alloalcanivorax dieselolei]